VAALDAARFSSEVLAAPHSINRLPRAAGGDFMVNQAYRIGCA
jgi:hypothetical protein